MLDAAYWLALTYASGLKLARVKAIISAWCLEEGRPLATLGELNSSEMADRLDLSKEEAEGVVAAIGRLSEQAAWLERLAGEGTQLITRADRRYPPALIRWFPPALQPVLLFGRGELSMLSHPSAAVIGGRDAGGEAVDFARELATLLAEEGLVVVSGLGKGVGQAALGGALSAEGGQSIAVLPMGINVFSGMSDPAEALPAAVQQGRALLLSPFHPGAEFTEAQAIARNKLMVGLAQALFVVTAGQEGVARQTADEALRMGKAVYVWDADPALEPTATGNQALIQAGALPIGGLSDILDAVEAIVAAALELAEMSEASPVPAQPAGTQPASQVKEAQAEYNPQAVLDLLSEAGRVPEVLARRLREEEEAE